MPHTQSFLVTNNRAPNDMGVDNFEAALEIAKANEAKMPHIDLGDIVTRGYLLERHYAPTGHVHLDGTERMEGRLAVFGFDAHPRFSAGHHANAIYYLKYTKGRLF